MLAGGAAKPRLATPPAERKKAALAAPLRAALAAADQGPVVSQGDVTHAVDKVRERRHLTGIGTKICALSDGVWSLAEEQAGRRAAGGRRAPRSGGRLPEDEGTAMLEIIHDLAPRAALGFATADGGPAQFADNIRALRFDAHCDVIVDDVLYFDEGPFQDGPDRPGGQRRHRRRRAVLQLGRQRGQHARRDRRATTRATTQLGPRRRAHGRHRARLRSGARRPGVRAAVGPDELVGGRHPVVGGPAGRLGERLRPLRLRRGRAARRASRRTSRTATTIRSRSSRPRSSRSPACAWRWSSSPAPTATSSSPGSRGRFHDSAGVLAAVGRRQA